MVTTSITLNKKEYKLLQEIADKLGITKHALIKALIRRAILIFEKRRVEELREELREVLEL